MKLKNFFFNSLGICKLLMVLKLLNFLGTNVTFYLSCIRPQSRGMLYTVSNSKNILFSTKRNVTTCKV